MKSKKIFFRNAALVSLVLLAQSLYSEVLLSSDVLAMVGENVFEVVVKKSEADSFRYAERLPIELLPYSERTDLYKSIGTAFALDDGSFVSAGHVFAPQNKSLWTEYALRDSAGSIFPVGNITSYSYWRDYMVFDVPLLKVPGLKTLASAPLNSKVFSIGNALGQGVIIRDGILTSLTPEDWKGEWKWLRFSAPASPGNSGGPLVDAQGRVLGIVLRKSENENLNYALPLGQVGRDGKAFLDTRMSYTIPNILRNSIIEVHMMADLPLSLNKLRGALSDRMEAEYIKAAQQVVSENKADLFPVSPKSAPVLGDTKYVTFPSLLTQQSDNTWKIDSPEKTYSAQIGKDGSLIWGDFLGYTFFNYRKTGEQTVSSLFSDPASLADSMLQGYKMTRNIAGKEIRVDSFGSPYQTRAWVDAWGRKWYTFVWTMPVFDTAFMIMALPTPSGCYYAYKQSQFGLIGAYEADFRVMSDFACLSYEGSLKDWKEFIQASDLLPEILKSWHMSYENNAYLSLDTSRFSFYPDPKFVEINDTCRIGLQPSYFRQLDKVVWDTGFLFYVNGTADKPQTWIYGKKWKPSETAGESEKKSWNDIVNANYPYEGTHLKTDGNVSIWNLVPGQERDSPVDPEFKFWVNGYFKGTQDDAFAESRQQAAVRAFSLSGKEIDLGWGIDSGDKAAPEMFRIKGRTIFAVIRSGDLAGLKEFIAMRKDLELLDGSGNTPLLAALKENKKDLAEALVAASSGISQSDRDGSTPLMLSMDASFGNLPDSLYRAGASVDPISRFGQTALSLALQNGRDALACSIIKKNGAALTGRLADDWTPLMLAIRHKNPESIKVLLADDNNLRGVQKDGWNVLHMASRYRSDLVMTLLPRLSPAVNQKSETGATPLSLLAQYGNGAQLRWMIDAGASVASANNEGWTAMMFALRYGTEECARTLLAYPDALDGRNKDGWQALHFAARYKPDLLPAAVASVRSQDKKTMLEAATLSLYRPLHLAVIAHSVSAVQWLLEQGVDRAAKTAEGFSALDLAEEMNDAAISALLTP